jgi:hypothetical protein
MDGPEACDYLGTNANLDQVRFLRNRTYVNSLNVKAVKA